MKGKIRMLKFVRTWSWEIALGVIALAALGIALSITTNKQVAYAPCLANVVSAIRADPAALRFAKLASEPVMQMSQDCDIAEDVAREANRAITDLLINDNTLYERLPKMLADAGMACRADPRSITCDCKKSGPFAIANPFGEPQAGALVDLPLPLKRALFVAVDKHPAVRKGQTVQPGKYVVEVSYGIALIEPDPPAPRLSSAAMVSQGIVDQAYAW